MARGEYAHDGGDAEPDLPAAAGTGPPGAGLDPGERPGLAAEATGVSIVFARLSQTNIRSMLTGTISAMALISLILVLVFRSVRLGLVSLVPNFIPAALSFGIWGYLVGRVGLAGSVMTAIAFGIIVDDTIHFLSKYLRARRDGAAPADAVRSTFAIVGHAMWTTTVVLCLGFLVFGGIGLRDQLGPRTDGDAHDLHCAARRLPAPAAAAHGRRPEITKRTTRVSARSVVACEPPRNTEGEALPGPEGSPDHAVQSASSHRNWLPVSAPPDHW